MAATVDQKLLKATKFPPEFNQKVDMRKVNSEVMKKYSSPVAHNLEGSPDTNTLGQMDSWPHHRDSGQRGRHCH